MDVYVLTTTFSNGWDDDYTNVIGVYTELKDAMNAGEEIQKNNPETFCKAFICRRRLGEAPNDYKFDFVLRAWDGGIWYER